MYRLTASPDIVIRIADEVSIPLDETNVDCQAYLAWLEEGGTPEPAPQADAKVAAQARVEALERANQLPRVVREFMLDVIEEKAATLGAGQGLTKPQALALLAARNVGYANVKALDAEIATLRAVVRG